MDQRWPMTREWELLVAPVQLDSVAANHLGLAGDITIRRGETYDIVLNAAGHPPRAIIELMRSQPAGTVVKRRDLVGRDGSGAEVSCEHVFGAGFALDDDGPRSVLSALGVRRREGNITPVVHTEWFAGGPASHVVYAENTTRILEARAASQGTGVSFALPVQSIKEGTLDALTVESGEHRLTIRRVPKWVGVEQYRPLAIDFKSPVFFGDRALRRAVSEAVGFFTGRQLLSVGWTQFAENAQVVESLAVSPWGGDPASICRMATKPPVPFSEPGWELPKISGKLLGQALATYLPRWSEIWNDLDVTGALSQLWIARRLPLGPNLPVLWSALERMARKWFEAKGSKSRGLWSPSDEYSALVAPVRVAVHESKANDGLKAKLLSKIEEANILTATAGLRKFFDELALTVSKREWEALGLRHGAAHGGPGADSDELIWASGTVETLVSRVILKLLHWTDGYVDYGLSGWPTKKLAEGGG